MQRQFEATDPHEMPESVLAHLQNCNCHSLPVVRDGALIGLLSADNLGELLLIQEAMRGKPSSAARSLGENCLLVPIITESQTIGPYRGQLKAGD
jgi:hypothetical protein